MGLDGKGGLMDAKDIDRLIEQDVNITRVLERSLTEEQAKTFKMKTMDARMTYFELTAKPWARWFSKAFLVRSGLVKPDQSVGIVEIAYAGFREETRQVRLEFYKEIKKVYMEITNEL